LAYVGRSIQNVVEDAWKAEAKPANFAGVSQIQPASIISSQFLFPLRVIMLTKFVVTLFFKLPRVGLLPPRATILSTMS